MLSSKNHALALISDQAFVWDYNTSSSSPTVRTFALPNPSQITDPLPLGTLVESGAGSDIGLVVIAPTTGQITYWESIEDADALSLFTQKRNGLEGNIGGLSSGEVIVGLEDLNDAGIILLFSSGRIAHLTLRDTQSKPALTINFLKSQSSNSRGIGLFGTIRSALGGSGSLKNVIAIRSRKVRTRGQAEAVIANEDAVFQLWHLGWSGQAYMQKEIDARNALDTAIKTMLEPEIAQQAQSVNLIDFVITPGSSLAVTQLSQSENPEPLDLLALISISGESTPVFVLAEVKLIDNIASVRRLLHLNSYSPPLSDNLTWKPRLSVPQPFHTAFITFEKAVTIISLDKLALSPDAQLAVDIHKLPEPFQDSIYLRDDKDVDFTGVAPEHAVDSSHSAVILSIKDFGLIRIAAFEPSNDLQAIERFRISAKSRIEQAVFFGKLPSNPLNLSRKPVTSYKIAEVETAALVISREVIGSYSQFIPNVASSMEQHLHQRVEALHNLASHLKNAYPALSRHTRWQLRWDAEKLAAAQAVWMQYDSQGQGRMRLLPNLISMMHERYKTELSMERGEVDAVRHWFLKDVYRIETLVAWAYQALSELHRDEDVKDSITLLQLVSDADDLTLGSLETAYKFRTENAWLYNLEEEDVDDDLLKSGYADLPEPWTSEFDLVERTRKLTDAVRGLVLQFASDNKTAFGPTDTKLVLKITEENARLVAVTCKGFEERIRWCLAQPDTKNQANGHQLQQAYEQARCKMLVALTEIDMGQQAMELAERYADMPALVALVQCQTTSIVARVSTNSAQDVVKRTEADVVKLESCVKRYFDEFGRVWADAFYMGKLQRDEYSELLDAGYLYQPELTRFLRETPDRKKLSWINDVLGEHDYATAAKSLSDVACNQESGLWNKKVQLSLSKLALVASHRSAGTAVNGPQVDDKRKPDGLELVRIQEKLYAHIRSSFHNAVDRSAELQLVMDAFGKRITKGKPACHDLLERGLERLVDHKALDAEQLIDVLTLMDQRQSDSKFDNIAGQEMFLAFQALRNSGLSETDGRYVNLLRIIWRRLFIRDMWDRVNNTAQKSDESVVEDLEWTTLFETFCRGEANGKHPR